MALIREDQQAIAEQALYVPKSLDVNSEWRKLYDKYYN
jgi:hypothetical protein